MNPVGNCLSKTMPFLFLYPSCSYSGGGGWPFRFPERFSLGEYMIAPELTGDFCFFIQSGFCFFLFIFFLLVVYNIFCLSSFIIDLRIVFRRSKLHSFLVIRHICFYESISFYLHYSLCIVLITGKAIFKTNTAIENFFLNFQTFL